MRSGRCQSFDLLNREIARLKELSALIDQVAEIVPTATCDPAMLQRWWPDFVRTEMHSTPD